VTDDERRLREAFQTQRAVERARSPGFGSVLKGRPAPTHRSFVVPTLGGVVFAGLVVLGVSIRRAEARRAELELARQVMSWRGPTEFLLPAAVPGLLPSVPRIDEAPAGSPLKALDNGGALGPPITARSPRS
jgi:hypothetical protein